MSDHHTDEALRRVEPIDRDRLIASWSHSEAKQALFQEIASMPVETPARPYDAPKRRMPRRRLVPAAVAVVTLLTGTVAIASGGFVTENTPGVPERTMGEFVDTVEPYRGEFTFAPHRSFDEAVAAIDATSPDDDAIMGIDGMTDMVGTAAVCSWLDYWRTATLDDDDAAAAATAVENVTAAREWPWALVNTEFFAQNLSSHVAAMEAGDVTYVTWELGLNCLPAMTEVPPISPTGPVPDGIEEPTTFYRDANAPD